MHLMTLVPRIATWSLLGAATSFGVSTVAAPEARACDACSDEEHVEDGGDPSDLHDAECIDFEEEVEGGSSSLVMYFESRLAPNAPVHELLCSGTVEASCRTPAPFVCGAGNLAFFVTTDESRPTLIAAADSPMSVQIGETVVDLKPACARTAQAAKANTCRHYEARIQLDVRATIDRMHTGYAGGIGSWSQVWKVLDQHGGLIARGQLELSEFDDMVGMLGLMSKAPDARRLNGGVVLLTHEKRVVEAIPESADIPLNEARYLLHLITPVLTPATACLPSDDPAAPNGVLSQEVSGLMLEVFDRETGLATDTVRLPPLPAGIPCANRFFSLEPTWLVRAYRDLVMAEAARVTGAKTLTPAAPGAGMRMPLGLAAPTLEALLKRVKGVRTVFGMLLSNRYPGLVITTKMHTIESIMLRTGAGKLPLAAWGLDATFAGLLGGPSADLEKLLGAPAKRDKSTFPPGEAWAWDATKARLGMDLRAIVADGKVVQLLFARR
jgi:hypothetical protein